MSGRLRSSTMQSNVVAFSFSRHSDALRAPAVSTSREAMRRRTASSCTASSSTTSTLRSEEHTSELQSLRHLVCRLLLEKKKKKNKHKTNTYKNKNNNINI